MEKERDVVASDAADNDEHINVSSGIENSIAGVESSTQSQVESTPKVSREQKKTNYDKSLEILHGFFPDLQPEDIEQRRMQLEQRQTEIEAQMKNAKRSFLSSLIRKRSEQEVNMDRELIDELAQVILDLEHLKRVSRLINKAELEKKRLAA